MLGKSGGGALLGGNRGRGEVSDWSWANHPDRHCRGINTNVFFPSTFKGRNARQNVIPLTRMAKEICHGCPVLRECFRYAVDNHEEGIWGGTTLEERERMRCRVGQPD